MLLMPPQVRIADAVRGSTEAARGVVGEGFRPAKCEGGDDAKGGRESTFVDLPPVA